MSEMKAIVTATETKVMTRMVPMMLTPTTTMVLPVPMVSTLMTTTTRRTPGTDGANGIDRKMTTTTTLVETVLASSDNDDSGDGAETQPVEKVLTLNLNENDNSRDGGPRFQSSFHQFPPSRSDGAATEFAPEDS
jgi:hypothetical protein